MRLSSLFLFSCLLWGCTKVNPSTTKIFGHGATGLKAVNAIYHDNSMEGINYSLALPNCSGVEVDVRMDQEGTLWLYHDATLATETNLFGSIEQSTSSQLSQGHYTSINKEKLVQMDASCAQVLGAANVFLDLKISSYAQALEMKSALFGLNLDTVAFSLLVSSYSFVEVFKNEFQVYLSVEDFSSITNEMIENQPFLKGFCIRNQNISKEQVNFLKSIHKEIILYEVRSPKGIKTALNKNPDYLLTDDLKLTLGMAY